MRALFLALIGLLLVVGCGAPPTGPGEPVDQVEALSLSADATSAEPASAETVPVVPELPPPPPEPPLLVQERAACLRAGGQMMLRGGGIHSCIQPTRDAGRACTSASDCQGLCLARSGTCAPYQPLFGCHEVFTVPGRRETLCVD